MRTLDLAAFIGVALSIFLIVVLLISPTERRSKRRGGGGMFGRRKDDNPQKDWEAAALRLEKHVHKLNEEVAAEKNRYKVLERELMVQQQKYGQAREKLKQERGWQQKEEADSAKKNKQVKDLKTYLTKVESQLGVEHGERIKLERELQEVNHGYEETRRTVASLENELHSFRKQGQEYRQEILHLKEENARLKKEKDNTTWVAKSDFVKIEKELAAAKKELEDLRRKKYSPSDGMGG